MAVDFVVCRHDRARLGFFDSNFERLKVDLSECSFADNLLDAETLGFLLVRREMFDGSRDASRLHTEHILSSELAGQVGILREALEVTTTERMAMRAHCWSKKTSGALGQSLLSKSYTDSVCKVGVECGRNTAGGGKAGSGDTTSESCASSSIRSVGGLVESALRIVV